MATRQTSKQAKTKAAAKIDARVQSLRQTNRLGKGSNFPVSLPGRNDNFRRNSSAKTAFYDPGIIENHRNQHLIWVRVSETSSQWTAPSSGESANFQSLSGRFEVSNVPQRLHWTASLSCSAKPAGGAPVVHPLGRNSPALPRQTSSRAPTRRIAPEGVFPKLRARMAAGMPSGSGGVRGRDRGVPRRGHRPAARFPAPTLRATHSREVRRSLLPPAHPIRDHRRAKAAPAPVDRGWERGDQRAGFALGQDSDLERADAQKGT